MFRRIEGLHRATICTVAALAAAPVLTAAAQAATSGGGAPKAVAVAPASAAAQAVGTRTLRFGDSGPRVVALQQLLAAAGFKLEAGGSYDARTRALVRRFQHAAGLAVSGVADKKTLVRLRRVAQASPAPVLGGAAARTRTTLGKHLGDRIPLRRGMEGHDVKILQSYLRRSGFAAAVDGAYDDATSKQVRRFERANEVDADGVVDANDLAILRTAVEGDPQPVADVDATRTTPGEVAKLGADGLAIAPESAPDAVKAMIAAGNRIAKTPYIYGGGHGSFKAAGYDCSGSVSFALHGGGVLDSPLDSGAFMSWGDSGRGDWVTIYTNPGHAYMVVAGLRFDTSGRRGNGSRWQTQSRPSSGFRVRHPRGL